MLDCASGRGPDPWPKEWPDPESVESQKYGHKIPRKKYVDKQKPETHLKSRTPSCWLARLVVRYISRLAAIVHDNDKAHIAHIISSFIYVPYLTV
jgi:hypothetical protein